jgi:histidine triad (HIT) family protein
VNDCIFCRIVAGDVPVTTVDQWDDAIAFIPHNPVAQGESAHVLVVPEKHVVDFLEDPQVTALTAERAAELANWLKDEYGGDWNLITSAGPDATQTVEHLHLHLVRRVAGDGLHLPWTGQAERLAAEQAQRDADELVAPEPVCTCDPNDQWVPCSIHRWVTKPA